MNYQEIISNLKLTEEDAAELVSYGAEAIDYSFKIYEGYIKRGQEVPKAFPFLRKVCQNYLQKKTSQASEFNASGDKPRQESKDYQGPQMYKINFFVWKEHLSNPVDIAYEDQRFESWLRSKDGGEYLKVYGLGDVPEHFQYFAREVLRFNHQTKLMKKHKDIIDNGGKVIGPVTFVRPIADRKPASYAGYAL